MTINIYSVIMQNDIIKKMIFYLKNVLQLGKIQMEQNATPKSLEHHIDIQQITIKHSHWQKKEKKNKYSKGGRFVNTIILLLIHR